MWNQSPIALLLNIVDLVHMFLSDTNLIVHRTSRTSEAVGSRSQVVIYTNISEALNQTAHEILSKKNIYGFSTQPVREIVLCIL